MADKPVTARRTDPHADVDADSAEPTTGVHPASRDFVREVNQSGLFRVAWWIGGAVVVVFGAGVLGARAVAQEAHDAGVEAAKAHESRITAVEQQVPELRQEVFASRVELRELYKAVVDHKRSEDLERPPPELTKKDGGR